MIEDRGHDLAVWAFFSFLFNYSLLDLILFFFFVEELGSNSSLA